MVPFNKRTDVFNLDELAREEQNTGSNHLYFHPDHISEDIIKLKLNLMINL